MESNFIYNRYIYSLLISINDALVECIRLDMKGKNSEIHIKNDALIQCFSNLTEEFGNLKGKDAHIFHGIGYSSRFKYNNSPRALKILINAYNETKELRSQGSFIVPSPLNVLYHLLIHPDYLNTAAYSVASCRYFLFSLLELYPENPNITENSFSHLFEKQVSIEDVTDSYYSFNQNIKIQARWPRDIGKTSKQARRDFLLGHFLAMKGVAFLWFSNFEKALEFVELSKSTFKTQNIVTQLNSIKELRQFINDKDHLRYKLVREKNTLDQNEQSKFKKEIKTLEYKIAKIKTKTKIDKDTFIDVLKEKYLQSRFRLSPKYESVPDINQILNQIYGIPTPLEGADVIFFGGLKTSANGGLVIGVDGDAGTGKTSFALSIANYLEPFNTNTFYISLEEGVEEVKDRLFSLRPSFYKELSIFNNGAFFEGIRISRKNNFNDFNNQLEVLSNRIKAKKETKIIGKRTGVPTICPALIIIDNINELIEGNEDNKQYELAEQFIDKCRKLNALVIIISGSEVMKKLQLDYLVDIGVNLSNSGIEQFNEKPIRKFKLYKTRHQISRQGSHIFHMSGSEGFRISPQINSQIDKKKKVRKNPLYEDRINNALNIIENGNVLQSVFDSIDKHLRGDRDRYIKLYPNTNILIHGYGSSGKAAIALKILLTPSLSAKIKPIDVINKGLNNFELDKKEENRRVLVVSFLYTESYYDKLVGLTGSAKLQPNISKLYETKKPKVDYIILYPGNLTPNDFINKVTKKLNSAIIEGEPYNGVLVDGLHNVFIQFPLLQEAQTVWSTLQSLLARYDLTVVNTFTNFSINDKLVDNDKANRNQVLSQSIPDHLLLQKGMTPLLSLMVNSTDFYIYTDQEHVKGKIRHFLSIKSSINQYIPTEILEWDRNRCSFIRAFQQTDYEKMLNEGLND